LAAKNPAKRSAAGAAAETASKNNSGHHYNPTVTVSLGRKNLPATSKAARTTNLNILNCFSFAFSNKVLTETD
jgi:hypothetical protein